MVASGINSAPTSERRPTCRLRPWRDKPARGERTLLAHGLPSSFLWPSHRDHSTLLPPSHSLVPLSYTLLHNFTRAQPIRPCIDCSKARQKIMHQIYVDKPKSSEKICLAVRHAYVHSRARARDPQAGGRAMDASGFFFQFFFRIVC